MFFEPWAMFRVLTPMHAQAPVTGQYAYSCRLLTHYLFSCQAASTLIANGVFDEIYP